MIFSPGNRKSSYQQLLASIDAISVRFQGTEGFVRFSENMNLSDLENTLEILWKHNIHLSFVDHHFQGHFDYFRRSSMKHDTNWTMTFVQSNISWGDYRIQKNTLIQQLRRLIQHDKNFHISVSEIVFSSGHGIRSLEASIKWEEELIKMR
ncbi:MAG: hypothetical protein Crog4KO_26300 [Crocinitomicaceae bacterium]